jgi:hypothetical protein
MKYTSTFCTPMQYPIMDHGIVIQRWQCWYSWVHWIVCQVKHTGISALIGNMSIQDWFPYLCHFGHFLDIPNVIMFRWTSMVIVVSPIWFNAIRDLHLFMMFGHLPPLPTFSRP